MLPGICGLVIVIVFALQIISSLFYFTVDELNDTDFSEDDENKTYYDYYTDDYFKVKGTFLSVVITGVFASGLSVYFIWKFIESHIVASHMHYLLLYCLFVGVLYILYLGVGIFVPYHLSSKDAKKVFLKLKKWYWGIETVFSPMRVIANGISIPVSILFGVDPRKEIDDVTEEDVIDLINEGHEQGVFKASEATMIQNIFEFDDKIARDIMINRKNVCALDGDGTLKDAIRFFNDNHYSRIPVYIEDLDHIIGIIHMKEILKYSSRTDLYNRKIRDLADIMYTPEFVPETHGIHTLFTQMQLSKSHLIVVVDEYGQMSGIVSMEDILEEIVGNIEDEHDVEDESVLELPKDEYLMHGSTDMDEVMEKLNLSIDDCEFETLNGFLTNLLGEVPKDGEKYEISYENYLFHVLGVENKIVTDVRVCPLEEGSCLEQDV
ncbi:MAG: hemolysin family protein [Lachnospiraceae bacterium]|nr:hemolysin family protein [Lachnospiraceae bacterium]